MKNPSIALILIALLLVISPSYVYAESFCERVNRGGFNEYTQLTKSMNKMLDAKGARYKTSAKEMKKVITGYCKSKPYDTGDDALNFLTIMAETVAAAEKMK